MPYCCQTHPLQNTYTTHVLSFLFLKARCSVCHNRSSRPLAGVGTEAVTALRHGLGPAQRGGHQHHRPGHGRHSPPHQGSALHPGSALPQAWLVELPAAQSGHSSGRPSSHGKEQQRPWSRLSQSHKLRPEHLSECSRVTARRSGSPQRRRGQRCC